MKPPKGLYAYTQGGNDQGSGNAGNDRLGHKHSQRITFLLAWFGLDGSWRSMRGLQPACLSMLSTRDLLKPEVAATTIGAGVSERVSGGWNQFHQVDPPSMLA